MHRLLLCIAAQAPFGDIAAALGLAYAFGGMFGFLRALLKGDLFNAGSLNAWDEALAFVALSRLADLLRSFHL